jgi:hypothetical protein
MSNPGRSRHPQPDSQVAISTFAIQFTLRRFVRTRGGCRSVGPLCVWGCAWSPAGVIPLIVFKPSRNEKDFILSYDQGVNRCIQKPIDFDQFRETVRAFGVPRLPVNQASPQNRLDAFLEKRR